MKAYRMVAVLAVLVVSAVVALGASAQSGPYLQINNGDRISVNANEQPQVVLQFGGGQAGFADAGVLCLATGGIRINGGQVFTHGFSDFSVEPTTQSAVSFPSAGNFIAPAGARNFRDIPQGQNFNVAFGLDLSGVNPAADGQVLCVLVNGEAVADIAVGLGLGLADLTSTAVVDLLISLVTNGTFPADAVTVDVR